MRRKLSVFFHFSPHTRMNMRERERERERERVGRGEKKRKWLCRNNNITALAAVVFSK